MILNVNARVGYREKSNECNKLKLQRGGRIQYTILNRQKIWTARGKPSLTKQECPASSSMDNDRVATNSSSLPHRRLLSPRNHSIDESV